MKQLISACVVFLSSSLSMAADKGPIKVRLNDSLAQVQSAEKNLRGVVQHAVDALAEAAKVAAQSSAPDKELLASVAQLTSFVLAYDQTRESVSMILPVVKKHPSAWAEAVDKLSTPRRLELRDAVQSAVREEKEGNG